METKDTLRFVPFTSPADKGWDEAWAIYENSFPYKEQRSMEDHLRALEDPRFEAEGIWLGDRLAGFLNHWTWGEGFSYCEHLAMSPELRGQRVGSRALEAFCARAGKVVLEIDLPVDDISIRRLHFYQRLGFVDNPYVYRHPSYRPPFTTHQLVLMSYPDPLTDAEAERFADFVREEVLRYSRHESPALPQLP